MITIWGTLDSLPRHGGLLVHLQFSWIQSSQCTEWTANYFFFIFKIWKVWKLWVLHRSGGGLRHSPLFADLGGTAPPLYTPLYLAKFKLLNFTWVEFEIKWNCLGKTTNLFNICNGRQRILFYILQITKRIHFTIKKFITSTYILIYFCFLQKPRTDKIVSFYWCFSSVRTLLAIYYYRRGEIFWLSDIYVFIRERIANQIVDG